MIELLREPIPDALHSERILELPKFIRSGGGTYWHIPRSASLRHGEHLCVSLWCGPHLHDHKTPLLLTDVEPAEDICGTCLGRFEGAQSDGPLIFRPRDEFATPTWCPSTEPDSNSMCIACGHRIRPYGWQGHVGSHRPGPLFAERCRPCPDHGWSRAGTHDGRVVCWAHVGYDFGYCHFDCGPHLG